MHDEPVGLIPAAGKGVRLGLPYPKELYPVIRNNRYKPVAEFVLDNLRQAGVCNVVIVINETKHQLMAHFGDGHRFGLRLAYAFQEQLPNGNENGNAVPSAGLAEALDSGFHLVRGRSVYFGMPDTIMDPPDVFAQLRASAGAYDDFVLALFPTTRPEKFGMVELNERGDVTRVIDKPARTRLTHMWGCVMWRPRFSEYLHELVHNRGVHDFAAILNSAIENGFRGRGVRLDQGSYRDLGTYEEIMELEKVTRQL